MKIEHVACDLDSCKESIDQEEMSDDENWIGLDCSNFITVSSPELKEQEESETGGLHFCCVGHLLEYLGYTAKKMKGK